MGWLAGTGYSLGFKASSSNCLMPLSMCPLMQKEDHANVDLRFLFNKICTKLSVNCTCHRKDWW